MPETRSLSLAPIRRDAHTIGIPSGTIKSQEQSISWRDWSWIALITKSTFAVATWWNPRSSIFSSITSMASRIVTLSNGTPRTATDLRFQSDIT